MSKLILVLGGAKSGKSLYAENLVADKQVAYIATAEVHDKEMEQRVQAHRARRPASWLTFETPMDIESALSGLDDKIEFVIIDCLTIYITNLLLKVAFHDDDSLFDVDEACFDSIVGKVESLCYCAKGINANVVLVSNEVGFGIVPNNKLARVFRDIAGRANQIVANKADEVFFVVAGIAQKIK